MRIRFLRASLILTAVIATLLLGACGDDGEATTAEADLEGQATPDDQVRVRADEFWTALANGDGDTACALATPAVQAQLADPAPPVHREDGSIIPEPDLSCADGAASLGSSDDPQSVGEEFDSGEVVIRKDEAQVVAETSGRCMHLLNVRDEWLVASLPVPPLPETAGCSSA